MPKLYKETVNQLVFSSKNGIEKQGEAEKSIKQFIGGTNSIIQGIAELRNAYGTGHGKCPEFKGLPTQYTQLVVSIVSDIAVFILQINGEQTEINS